MPTGVGIDAMTVGGNIVGRTALDDRLLVRSGFHNLGIVMGCRVTGSATAMAYVIDSGADPVSVAVASRGGADGATTFPITSGTVTTSAAPASGSRIDLIWARQNDPSKGDADNLVTVGVTQGNAAPTPVAPALPAGAVELARALVPSGATRGSATTLTPGPHAIPYGTSLGVLHTATDTASTALTFGATTERGKATIVLPTPRRVEFVLRPTVATATAGQTGSMLYSFRLDGVDIVAFEHELTHYWKTGLIAFDVTVPAGEHTVSYTEKFHSRSSSGVTASKKYGPVGGNWGALSVAGTIFKVADLGVG